jgi:hypothetical protein
MSIINQFLTLLNTPVPEKAEKPETKRGRQPSNPIDHNMADPKVYKAVLHHSFNGAPIAKIYMSCPRFAKDEQKNRNIINEALESLQARSLIKIDGTGRDRFIRAENGGSMASYYHRGESPFNNPFKGQAQKSN